MRCDSDSDDSFSASSSSNEPGGGTGRQGQAGQSCLQQLISLNVTIFNDLGFSVSADSFSHAPHPLEEEPNRDSESERSEIDYGDSEEYPLAEEE